MASSAAGGGEDGWSDWEDEVLSVAHRSPVAAKEDAGPSRSTSPAKPAVHTRTESRLEQPPPDQALAWSKASGSTCAAAELVASCRSPSRRHATSTAPTPSTALFSRLQASLVDLPVVSHRAAAPVRADGRFSAPGGTGGAASHAPAGKASVASAVSSLVTAVKAAAASFSGGTGGGGTAQAWGANPLAGRSGNGGGVVGMVMRKRVAGPVLLLLLYLCWVVLLSPRVRTRRGGRGLTGAGPGKATGLKCGHSLPTAAPPLVALSCHPLLLPSSSSSCSSLHRSPRRCRRRALWTPSA
jgi:hypothetical protein